MSRRGGGRLGGGAGGGPGRPCVSPPHLPCSLEAVWLGPCSGLLVDWLEMLDPEVVSSCPDLQQRLLFSQSTKVGLVRARRPGPTVRPAAPGWGWLSFSSSRSEARVSVAIQVPCFL